MKSLNAHLIFGIFTLLFASSANAAIQRNPIGVNVAADRAVSVPVRFADSNGAQFTSDQALFCFRQLANGQCDPTAILGRLPSSRDRGSTNVATSSISDVMTIPYSVIRSTVVIAQDVDFSDFYYVRRFIPAEGEDLGAGVNQPVYQKVTCHLAGPATVPLSLTRVKVFATEPYRDDEIRLIRLNSDNIDNGQVHARIEHTGTGTIEGWWEVRRPGDPRIKDSDRLPEGALSAQERGLRSRFLRIQSFRVPATAAGVALIAGPKYSELPAEISGQHQILLRIKAGRVRENRTRLAIDLQPLNVFSGSIAGFAIPVVEYHVPTSITNHTDTMTLLDPKLGQSTDQNGVSSFQLAWRRQQDESTVIRFTLNGERSILANAADGLVRLPASWSVPLGNNSVITAQFLDSAGQPVTEKVELSSLQTINR